MRMKVTVVGYYDAVERDYEPSLSGEVTPKIIAKVDSPGFERDAENYLDLEDISVKIEQAAYEGRDD